MLFPAVAAATSGATAAALAGSAGSPAAVHAADVARPGMVAGLATQIRWGLRYIRGRYGSPHRAWNHELAYGWY